MQQELANLIYQTVEPFLPTKDFRQLIGGALDAMGDGDINLMSDAMQDITQFNAETGDMQVDLESVTLP